MASVIDAIGDTPLVRLTPSVARSATTCDGGRITRELIQGMMAGATERSRSTDSVLADQFNNVDAIAGYRPLGDEIWVGVGGRIDAFVQAVGTGPRPGANVVAASRLAEAIGPSVGAAE